MMKNKNRQYYINSVLKKGGVKRKSRKFYAISKDLDRNLTAKQKFLLLELQSKFGYNIQIELF